MSDVQEFEFDLMIALPAGERDEDAMLDALYEAGCDDAIVGTGAAGLVALGFIREGADAEAVIAEAVGQALKALPEGATLREVRPDLVSLADVAARLQVSRQALQKREMPPPSLGGLYRVTEMVRYLEGQPGKIREGFSKAGSWFAAAPAAQKINAQLGLK
ncbi:MAG: hypothetical protein HLUCCA05_07375 [Roseibaca calidilacus]|jgi:hypothetical protein|uniref:DNA-binding protein n=1 Tax=Roseibaca calidilacus TaxID=1666912 RepID=A0A0N8K6V3_9RHOB|nr:hypothetical protein [Roseibaca calidilacus]KPP89977.1 MAG: hypothetical protein HLUCCA05_07375 [Roseibaca calidilacus]CUX81080.1 hypothetical protein Ga0058931_1518 [Roseibaca calidilacus]